MVLPTLRAIEPWPLAAELASAPEATPWTLIAAPAADLDTIADEIAKQLRSLLDVKVLRAQVGSAAALIDYAGRNRGIGLVIDGLEALDADEWRRIDLGRSRLARKQPAVLILDETCLALAAASAPNLWSWLGDSVRRGTLEGDVAESPVT